MTLRNYIVVILSLFTTSTRAQHTTIGELNSLLEKRDFFSLNQKLSMPNPNITTQDSLYFQASVQNAFGNNHASIAAIRRLSEEYPNQVEDDAWINLLNILADDYSKIYDYKSTAACYAILMNKYGKRLSKDDAASYTNSYTLYKSLEHIPAQTVDFINTTTVQLSADQENLWNVPTIFNQKDSVHFIFDSGAGFSTITATAARQLNLQIIPSKIQVGSANDKTIWAQLGIASEMRIGGAIFRHVVFLVIDDKMLHFPSIKYQIDGIVGFPVIHAMHRISITRNGILSINQSVNNEHVLPNFYYQGNAIRMLGRTGKDTLLFHLDTGAKQSELGKEYYDANSNYIRSVAEKKKYHLGGAGGVTAYKAFQLPDFPLQIGSSTKAILPYIPVYPNKVSPYGNAIGQDYIQLFHQMQIDFDRCYIDFQ